MFMWLMVHVHALQGGLAEVCVVRKVSGGYTPSPAANAKVGGAASGSSEHHGTEYREKQAD